jgi:hypothetical protein
VLTVLLNNCKGEMTAVFFWVVTQLRTITLIILTAVCTSDLTFGKDNVRNKKIHSEEHYSFLFFA